MTRTACMTRAGRLMRAARIPSIVATLAFGSTSAHAGPCAADIARLEQEIQASGASPDAGPSAPQSLAADLEHQPTPDSVAAARKLAEAEFATVLARAKSVDSGNDPACFGALAEARLIYFQ